MKTMQVTHKSNPIQSGLQQDFKQCLAREKVLPPIGWLLPLKSQDKLLVAEVDQSKMPKCTGWTGRDG